MVKPVADKFMPLWEESGGVHGWVSIQGDPLADDRIAQSIAEIRKTYDAFIKNLKKLKDLQPDLETNLDPVQDELQEKRNQLIDKIFPVTNIFAVYVSDKKLKKGTAFENRRRG